MDQPAARQRAHRCRSRDGALRARGSGTRLRRLSNPRGDHRPEQGQRRPSHGDGVAARWRACPASGVAREENARRHRLSRAARGLGDGRRPAARGCAPHADGRSFLWLARLDRLVSRSRLGLAAALQAGPARVRPQRRDDLGGLFRPRRTQVGGRRADRKTRPHACRHGARGRPCRTMDHRHVRSPDDRAGARLRPALEHRGDVLGLQDPRVQSGGQPDRAHRSARSACPGSRAGALLGGLDRTVGRHRKQTPRRKKAVAVQRKNIARSLMSLFKRGLRRIRFCLQRLIAPPPLWAAWKNDGWGGGRPELPEEEFNTASVSYRLMARVGLDRGPVSKVTQYLFQMRSRISRTAPSINLMKAPENETLTSAALPNHPGAVDYFSREQESFMDRYGDWLWLLLFAGGGISSVLAWMAEVFAQKRRELVDEILDRLTALISEARQAKTLAELDAVTTEIDHLVTHAIRYARQQATNTRAMSALILAIDAARDAVADHRRGLEGRRSSAGRLVQLFPERG